MALATDSPAPNITSPLPESPSPALSEPSPPSPPLESSPSPLPPQHLEASIPFPCLLVLIGIIAIGILIRCHHLSEISFWFDESFCWKMTTFNWSELWGRVARDNHPPLYFALLKLWIFLGGESATAMRILSVLLGAAAILGSYLLVSEVEVGANGDKKPTGYVNLTALLASAGVALAPFQVEWSQQVRMYALGSALTLWSSWFLLRAMRFQNHRKLWCGYVLTGSALAYTHYYGLFILAAHFLFAGGACLKNHFKSKADLTTQVTVSQVLLAFLLIGMGWSPWLPEFLSHRKQVVDSFWTQPLKVDDVTWTCVQMWSGTWAVWPVFNQRLAWVVAIASFLLWTWQIALGRGGQRLLALGPVVTFASAVGASLGSRNILSARYFVFAHALAVCSIAVCLQKLPTAWLRGICSILAILGLSWLCFNNVQQRDRWANRPGFQSAVAYLEELRGPGEPVFVGNPMVQINVAAYADDRASVYVLSSRQDYPYFQGSGVMRESEYVTPEQASQWSSSKIWVIETKNWTGGSIGVSLPAPWIDIREESFYDWHTPNCEVIVKECVRRRSVQIGNVTPSPPTQSHQMAK